MRNGPCDSKRKALDPNSKAVCGRVAHEPNLSSGAGDLGSPERSRGERELAGFQCLDGASGQVAHHHTPSYVVGRLLDLDVDTDPGHCGSMKYDRGPQNPHTPWLVAGNEWPDGLRLHIEVQHTIAIDLEVRLSGQRDA